MMTILKDVIAAARSLGSDIRAGISPSFAVIAVVLFGLTGFGIDYGRLISARSTLQNTADAAALAGAKEFRLSNAAVQIVTSVATNTATGILATKNIDVYNAVVTPTVDMTNKQVKVAIGADQTSYLSQLLGSSTVHIDVSATAKVSGGPPICVIGLDASANFTVMLDKNARIQAPGCTVYSNSTKASGLMAKNNAVITAGFICSAGGKSGAGPGSFSPTPQTDCPVLPDPLASRSAPTVGTCSQMNLVVDGTYAILHPGTYCGGLTIQNGANVKLTPGEYVFKDGPLTVTSNGALTGSEVGLYLTGTGAVINFDTLSTISLSAPASGVMAGMLIFEDASVPSGQLHQILSNNARMLLGTIYLPQNRLHVAAQQPVADQSAYTIVVARLFTLSEGPTMVLNTNYDATNIPVPAGVGPNANRTSLVQ